MECQITRPEIQKISLNFRSVANRLLTTKRGSGIPDLKRFLSFIESNPLIYDFVLKHQVKEYDISQAINRYTSLCDGYELPEDKSEEISFIYQLLKYGSENFNDYIQFTVNFGGFYGQRFDDQATNFNKMVVFPFYRYIEIFLSQLLIDLGEDQAKTVTINVQGDYMEDRSINLQSGDIHNQGVFNLGEISGNINQSINNLRASSNDNSEELANLLTELKIVIENEPALILEDKEQALEQVKMLAEASQETEEGRTKKMAKGALRMLKGIREELPTATKFLEETNKLLPLIGTFFGV